MRAIRKFEEFIQDGTVRKQTPDISRAKSLQKEAESSLNFLKKLTAELGITDESANSIIKLGYDIIMDLIRADMLRKGFNASGLGAHQAEVSYLRKLRLDEKDIQFCDQLRYFRNRIMYYGKEFDREYAEEALGFMNRLYSRLKSAVNYQ